MARTTAPMSTNYAPREIENAIAKQAKQTQAPEEFTASEDDYDLNDFVEEDFVPDPSLIIHHSRTRAVAASALSTSNSDITDSKQKNSRRKAKTKKNKKQQAKQPPKAPPKKSEERDDDDDVYVVDDFVPDPSLIIDHQSRSGKRKRGSEEEDEQQPGRGANEQEQKLSEQILESDQYFLTSSATKEEKLASEQNMLHIQRCTDRLISLIPKGKVKKVPFDPDTVQNAKSAIADLEACEIPKSLKHWDTHALLKQVLCRKLVPKFLDNGQLDFIRHQEFFKALYALDQIKSNMTSESKGFPKDTDPCNPQVLAKVCGALNLGSTRASEPLFCRGKKTFKGATHLESIRRCIVFLDSFRARKCLSRNFDKSSNNYKAIKRSVSRKDESREENHENVPTAGDENDGCPVLIDLADAPEDRGSIDMHAQNESHGHAAVKDLTDAPVNRDSVDIRAEFESRHGHSAMEGLMDTPEDQDFVDKTVQKDFGRGSVLPLENSLESVCGSHSNRSGPVRASRAKCANDITNFSIHVANQESALRNLASEMESSLGHIEDLGGYLSASKSGLHRISPRIADLTARENGLRALLQKHSTEADKIGSILASSSEE
eukprot:scaffold8306_cov171-Amphora_coffeaeformis.AAC.14